MGGLEEQADELFDPIWHPVKHHSRHQSSMCACTCLVPSATTALWSQRGVREGCGCVGRGEGGKRVTRLPPSDRSSLAQTKVPSIQIPGSHVAFVPQPFPAHFLTLTLLLNRQERQNHELNCWCGGRPTCVLLGLGLQHLR